jgi:hypothetical protein
MFVLLIGLGFVAFGHREWERMWVVALAGYVFIAFAAILLLGSRLLPTRFAEPDEAKPLV